ncbi:hypothetical protein [Haloimpatiens lingqiaonensis]|uniref:hypothetical protein n=1 Tax=Haloimpatiens lingqiaonensis TaxID=1380675 RepID=UPI0010FE0D12|nr:hypothetical protein [Haloimpatiens lingqiaonensis]
MVKKCIFNKNKDCNDCGECYICELDSKKVCNNCGKCMEREGFDLREIKIDEVLDMPDEITDYEDLDEDFQRDDRYLDLQDIKQDETSEGSQEEVEFEYIEDHEEIKEILENENEFNKMADEVFPGFIRIARKK